MADRRALTGNAGSPKQTRRANAIAQRRTAQMLTDTAEVLSTDAGVRMLHRLLDRWSAFRNIPPNGKATLLAYDAGRQSVAFELMQLLDAVPGSFARILALREADNHENAGLGSQTTNDEEDETDE